ncbi:MAG: 3-hydroxyacyl-CoA dehydrogenase NAD-binding domain-containing protein [Verrucomicrobia bacterium]|nr:3-hydroxyacyl-CoA dehydrogenase NAD-binding domain-containing protein [Verrucomicrobiota bacterium]
MNETVQLEVLTPDICCLVFDRPASSANIFDEATMEELSRLVDEIERSSYRAVIITSRKESIFVAGADIRQIATLDQNGLRGMITLGQSVFSRIAALKCVTVAAIHGACLGGGFELCLVCDYRIATDGAKTRIGLPETQLGILPAWGGCTRLPRLIGLPKAAAAILEGQSYTASHARRLGLVDDICPREHLMSAALAFVEKGKRQRRNMFVQNNPLMALMVKRKASARLAAKTHGNYPAPVAALEIILKAVVSDVDTSLQREEQAVLQLSQTSVCQHLMRVHFMQESAKKRSLPDVQAHGVTVNVQRCAVIGAGVMGAGIAQWLSAKGHEVTLKDVNTAQVCKGMNAIASLYKAGIRRHVFDRITARQGMDRIQPVTENYGLGRVDLVVEAAVERMDLKQAIFTDLAKHVRPDTILATNTSALSVTRLARNLPHPERVVGLHFFNPVSRMPLVEVVRGDQTSAEVVQACLRFVQQIGKLPVVVRDRPGFLVNRILMPYLVEAGRLFETGVPTETIDQAMLAFGMPMGPLRLIDEVGADVALHVAHTLVDGLGDRMQSSPVLEAMVANGFLGVKSGQGFYVYGKAKHDVPNHGLHASLKLKTSARPDVCPLADRLALTMLNEGARCLEDGVVSDPLDVDFAMIMGTGFAPFRGGPLRYAESFGIRECVDTLRRLATADGDHFAPSDRLVEMAEAGKHSFYEADHTDVKVLPPFASSDAGIEGRVEDKSNTHAGHPAGRTS